MPAPYCAAPGIVGEEIIEQMDQCQKSRMRRSECNLGSPQVQGQGQGQDQYVYGWARIRIALWCRAGFVFGCGFGCLLNNDAKHYIPN